jgi:hypothetical protein
MKNFILLFFIYICFSYFIHDSNHKIENSSHLIILVKYNLYCRLYIKK